MPDNIPSRTRLLGFQQNQPSVHSPLPYTTPRQDRYPQAGQVPPGRTGTPRQPPRRLVRKDRRGGHVAAYRPPWRVAPPDSGRIPREKYPQPTPTCLRPRRGQKHGGQKHGTEDRIAAYRPPVEDSGRMHEERMHEDSGRMHKELIHRGVAFRVSIPYGQSIWRNCATRIVGTTCHSVPENSVPRWH